MKVIRSHVERIAERYNLGSVTYHSKFEGGMNNDCYDVQTENDQFVFKVLGYDVNTYELGRRMYDKLDLEFRVLDYLEDNGFQYEIPIPLENKYGNRLSRIDGDYVIVAPKIEGTAPIDPDPTARREIGKGLGRYHALVEEFPEDFHYNDEVFPWVRDLLVEFREDETDDGRLEMIDGLLAMLDQLDAFGFEDRMERVRENALPAHSDFQPDNLLFEGDELVGIIDFDNIRPQPSVVDMAWTISMMCHDGSGFAAGAMDDLLEGYTAERVFPEGERELLLPVVVLHHCVRFGLAYRKVLAGEEDEQRLHTTFEQASEAWSFLDL